MAIKINVKSEGFDDVIRAMKNLEPEVRAKMIRPGLIAAGEVVRDTAKDRAPVRTGAYRNAFVVQFNKEPARGQARFGRAGKVGIGSTAPHAHLIELGTIHQPARPVSLDALQAKTQLQFTACLRAMRKQFARVVRAARRRGRRT